MQDSLNKNQRSYPKELWGDYMSCKHCKRETNISFEVCPYCAKNIKDIPLTLTNDQKDKLKKLWFIYGNYGIKANNSQHKWIQRMLDSNIDAYWFYKKTSIDSISSECKKEVYKIINENKKP